jgi:hypothetical protein
MQSKAQTFKSCRVQLEKALQQPDTDTELGSQEQELESNAALELLDTMVHVIEFEAKKFHLFDESEFSVIFRQDWHQLRNFADLMRIKAQLLKPRDLEDFKGALFWLTQHATEKELELIKKVRSNPPYTSKEIQRLLDKAQRKAEPQPITKSELLTPETMIAIAEIKDHAPDQPLQKGQSYCLKTGIKNDGLDENDPDSIQLDAVVWAEGMEISPKWIQPYFLDKNQKLSLIQFQLKPTSLGSKRIRVEFYYERHWLGEVKLEAQVVEAKQSAPM